MEEIESFLFWAKPNILQSFEPLAKAKVNS